MQTKVEGLYSMYQANRCFNRRDEARTASRNKEERDRIEGISEKGFWIWWPLFLKKQELIKPLQDKVFDAVSKYQKQTDWL